MYSLNSSDHLIYLNQHPNPFVKYGAKCYSQTDEDGLTLEIIKRIGHYLKGNTFLELGVGTGIECNTLVLTALGWGDNG